MYTYLENINQIKKRYNFPYNLIGKIKNIQLYQNGSIPYYQFTLYNDNTDEEITCIIKESLFEKHNFKEHDSVVIEYAHVKNFMTIDECFLIRQIQSPVLGLTGNKNEDILHLMETTKKLIESEYADGNLIQSRHSQINNGYLKFRKAYQDSRKRRKPQ